MKVPIIKLLVITTLVAAAATTMAKSGVTGGGDYYVIDTCPDFDSSQNVQNLDLNFSQIPTSGQPCSVTLTADIVKTFFMSYIEVVAKFNGVKIIDQKIEFDELENAGDKYQKVLPVPTTLMPSGVISGRATGYNEFGNLVQCYDYQIIVRKAPSN